MDLGLDGKTAVVLGASQGMGLAIAEALAAEGANVAMFARRRDVLEREAERIGALAVPGDLTSAEHREQLVGTTIAAFGGIDVLVLNGGGPPAGTAVGARRGRRRGGRGAAPRPARASRGDVPPPPARERRRPHRGDRVDLGEGADREPRALERRATRRRRLAEDALARARARGHHGEHDRPGAHRHRAPARPLRARRPLGRGAGDDPGGAARAARGDRGSGLLPRVGARLVRHGDDALRRRRPRARARPDAPLPRQRPPRGGGSRGSRGARAGRRWCRPATTSTCRTRPSRWPTRSRSRASGHRKDGGAVYYVDVTVREAKWVERILPFLRPDGATIVPEARGGAVGDDLRGSPSARAAPRWSGRSRWQRRSPSTPPATTSTRLPKGPASEAVATDVPAAKLLRLGDVIVARRQDADPYAARPPQRDREHDARRRGRPRGAPAGEAGRRQRHDGAGPRRRGARDHRRAHLPGRRHRAPARRRHRPRRRRRPVRRAPVRAGHPRRARRGRHRREDGSQPPASSSSTGRSARSAA